MSHLPIRNISAPLRLHHHRPCSLACTKPCPQKGMRVTNLNLPTREGTGTFKGLSWWIGRADGTGGVKGPRMRESQEKRSQGQQNGMEIITINKHRSEKSKNSSNSPSTTILYTSRLAPSSTWTSISLKKRKGGEIKGLGWWIQRSCPQASKNHELEDGKVDQEANPSGARNEDSKDGVGRDTPGEDVKVEIERAFEKIAWKILRWGSEEELRVLRGVK